DLDVEVRRQGGDVVDDAGDVLGGHRIGAVVERIGGGLVAAGAHQGELGLGHARLDRGHPHAGAVQVRAQPERELGDEGLGAAVHVAARVRVAAGDRTDV